MKEILLPPSSIATLPEWNDRELTNIDGLMIDLQKNGQEIPGEVITAPHFRAIAVMTPWLEKFATTIPEDKTHVMLTGHRRLAAMLRGVASGLLDSDTGYRAYLVDDIVKDAKDMRRRNVRENAVREDLTKQEKARKAMKMHLAEGISFEEIAEFFGKATAAGVAWAKACPQLVGLSPLGWVAYDRGDVEFNGALQLAKMPEKVQEDTLTRGIKTVVGLKAAVKDLAAGREPRPVGSGSASPKSAKKVLSVIEAVMDKNRKVSKTSVAHQVLKQFQLFVRSGTLQQLVDGIEKVWGKDGMQVGLLVLRGNVPDEEIDGAPATAETNVNAATA